jgi:2-dehydro-3-deoxyphosphooctonate aldolase (KDO 8-P synthase)
MLAEIKAKLDVPIATDLHEVDQAEPVAAVADLVQIPAFLCRQTDLIVAASRATAAARAAGCTSRRPSSSPPGTARTSSTRPARPRRTCRSCCASAGASFGYNNLVVDMLGIGQMQALGVPVTIDATHAVQLAGRRSAHRGGSTGGRREGVSIIAKAAVAAGADGVFLEFHTDPDKALCDGPSCLPLSDAAGC